VAGRKTEGAAAQFRLPRLRLSPLLFALAALSIGYLAFSTSRYVIRSHQLHHDRAAIERDIASLENHRSSLQAIREYLQSDEYLEQVARRELGLVRPGETLVIVSSSDPSPTPTSTPRAPDAPRASWWKELYGVP